MKLDHIQLAMPIGGEETARAFFSGMLGMKEEEKPYPLSERGGVWFRNDGVILHLGIEESFMPQRKAHPAFMVHDLEGLALKLEQEGNVVLWDHALPSRRRFYTNDPFGNRIELIREGDGFSQK